MELRRRDRLLSTSDSSPESALLSGKDIEKLGDNKSKPQKKGCLNRWFGKQEFLAREISFHGHVEPMNKVPNTIRNQKYNVLTFIPVVLYNQFKFFANLFFLLNALSQLIPVLQTGFFITYIGPLGLVLMLTMLKEAYDDWERYKRDKEANGAKYACLKGDHFELKTSASLKVGDIIEVNVNQRIPADLVLLYSSEPNGTVFLRTDQLDGETDWKIRKSVRFTQEHFSKTGGWKSLDGAKVIANAPIENIYQFEGLFEVLQNHKTHREPLTLENTLWGSTVLATGKIYAMVIYTGSEMRVVMNSREPRSKVGKLDQEVNFLSKILFCVMVGLSLFLVILDGFSGRWYIHFFRFIILLSAIIPISMRVNLDFAKLYYSSQINGDKNIEGTIARNRNIPEDLGRIQFLLTDKTGTITQNHMIFKKLSLENGLYTPDELNEIKRMLKRNCDKYKMPLNDVTKKEKDCIMRDVITALILCHNVTPVMDNGVKTFQASSPDEIALVQIAESLNMRLLERDQNNIKIENSSGITESYRILANFPFTSESKRMGIILQNVETQQIVFYLKGADTIMKDKVPQKQRGFLLDECESLAREGLRTLVITQKVISTEDFNVWEAKYNDACQSLSNRESKIRQVIESLEVNMRLLGITGVEDKLQEDICETLENLRNAGIQVWMLTGDKIETATCIAISAGIKSQKQEIFFMKDLTDPVEIKTKLFQFGTMYDKVLVMDGVTLAVALQDCYDLFFDSATKAPAVVLCRCSPTQKATVTEGVKKKTGKTTCAIGDGGNDVGMIQAADVGIGIEGKEGKQAALAADYSILKFKYLNRLLLWHGRLSYKRSAVLSNFVIHRGLIISIIQTVFCIVFYRLSISVYDGMLILGYSTVFTMFPVFSLIFDEDIDVDGALNYPPLYKTLQRGRELNLKTFLIWLWRSIYQGTVIMLLSFHLFDNTQYNIITITFTALIIAEMLNITSELNRMSFFSAVAICCSLLLYLGTIIILKDTINASSITLKFLYKVVSITLVSWLPLHALKVIMKLVDPSEQQKIMGGIKKTGDEHDTSYNTL